MERIEYRNAVDKSGWPRGPWDSEPDKIQWQDTETGLPCLIVRGPVGALCGYVGVPEGHKLYGKDYDDVEVDVHGGLTFANKCSPSAPENLGICHKPGEGEPDHVWWLGFDCAHWRDLCPSMRRYEERETGDTYKDIQYVANECAYLARQLAGYA